MAGRKRNIRRDRYSTTEIAKAVGITPRNIIYLCAERLLPVAEGGDGTGRHRLLDNEGFARAILIAAAADAGLPLLDGAALANAVWPRLGRALGTLTRDYMAGDVDLDGAYERQLGDYMLHVLDGRHVKVFQLQAQTDQAPRRPMLFPNVLGEHAGQQGPMFSVDPEHPGAPRFNRSKLFEHLKQHHRLLLEVNLSMAIARAALHMRQVKEHR